MASKVGTCLLVIPSALEAASRPKKNKTMITHHGTYFFLVGFSRQGELVQLKKLFRLGLGAIIIFGLRNGCDSKLGNLQIYLLPRKITEQLSRC